MHTREELLGCYGPVETRAIEEHKYFLGTELRRDPGLDYAVDSWERHYALRWRTERLRCDAQDQIRAIETYRVMLAQRYNRTVSFYEAFREWVINYGAEWRRQRDATPEAYRFLSRTFPGQVS